MSGSFFLLLNSFPVVMYNLKKRVVVRIVVCYYNFFLYLQHPVFAHNMQILNISAFQQNEGAMPARCHSCLCCRSYNVHLLKVFTLVELVIEATSKVKHYLAFNLLLDIAKDNRIGLKAPNYILLLESWCLTSNLERKMTCCEILFNSGLFCMCIYSVHFFKQNQNISG